VFQNLEEALENYNLGANDDSDDGDQDR